MNGLFTLLIAGIIIYLLFFRRGGMGCCGSHQDHTPGRQQDSVAAKKSSLSAKEAIIDLKEDDYSVVTASYKKRR